MCLKIYSLFKLGEMERYTEETQGRDKHKTEDNRIDRIDNINTASQCQAVSVQT